VGVSRINLTIDQLVLRGFEPGDRKTLVEGLQSELARVLSDPAARAACAVPHRTPVLRLGQMPLTPGASGSRKFGARVAGAIAKGLKP
jgi:hypothetical protein